MSEAKLRKQSVHGIDLYAVAPAIVSKICGCDVVLSFGNQPRQGIEALEDCASPSWPMDSLQQLLKHQSRCEYSSVTC